MHKQGELTFDKGVLCKKKQVYAVALLSWLTNAAVVWQRANNDKVVC